MVARSIVLFSYFRELPECSDNLAKYLQQMSQSSKKIKPKFFLGVSSGVERGEASQAQVIKL